MGQIYKGKITSIDSNGKAARVDPLDKDAAPTAKIVIPWHLRGDTGKLAKGTAVIFCSFEDGTGLILGRADGEWGEYLPKLTSDKIVDSDVRLANHKHSGVTTGSGSTGGPT